MSKNSLMAGASRFAHFAGLVRTKTAGGRADETEDQDPNARAAEDDEDDDEKKDDKESRRARGSDDDDDMKGDGGDDDEKKDDDDSGKGKGKSRRSSRAEDDDEEKRKDDDSGDSRRSRRASDKDEDEDDDDSEMRGSSTAAKARRRERARCAAIFATPQAAANLALACSLAFETNQTRSEAIRVLQTQPTTSSRASRQDNNPRLNPGDREQASRPGGGWDAAFGRTGAKVADKPLRRS